MRVNFPKQVSRPAFTRSWVNVKTEFSRLVGHSLDRSRNDLEQMSEHLGLTMTGRLHSGIDDVKNIAQVWLL